MTLPLALDGKVAVITGAGSGVGKAMAELFGRQGSTVAIVDVVASRVSEVVSGLSRSPRKPIGIVRDLSVKSAPESLVDEVMESQGRIDIRCNNAGIMDAVKPVAETDDERWDRVMSTNLNAPFRTSRRVLPTMMKQGGGAILNTASVAGLFGGRAGAAYTVSKHALIGLTRSIAASYGGNGIRCNAMVLGAVNTAIGLGGEPSTLGLEILKKAMVTMPRMADPAEIAKLALFLVTDDSSFVNGACITIDGGWTVY